MALFSTFARHLRSPIILVPFASGAPQIFEDRRSFLKGTLSARTSCGVHCAGVSTASPSRRPTILLFGDSNTQKSFSEYGWGAGLYNWFHRSCDVLNRGFSGYNTRWGRAILPGILEDAKAPVLAVTLFFGSNDSESTGQNVPLEEYEANLKAMIETVKRACPQALIIAITPPPVDHKQWPTRSNEQVAQYAAVVRGLPVSAVVDLWGWIEQQDLYDGLHLGPEGNRKVLALVQQAMREHGINPEDGPNGCPQMPMQFPHWTQLAGLSSEKAAARLNGWLWP